MRKRVQANILLFLALILAVSTILHATASASTPLANTYIRLTRMKTATTASVRVVFETSAASTTENSMTVDFNGADSTTWTGSSGLVNATQTISVATCPTETGTLAIPGSVTAAGSGSVVTISSMTNLAASTDYCFDLTSTSAVTLPTAGEYHPVVSTKTTAVVDDITTVAVRVVADDQITVTANVPPTFNFVLDSNATAFTADLTPGTKRQTTARTITVNTNAATGWVAWLHNVDANGLFSTVVNKNIAPTTPGTAVDLDAALSTEQYVWGVTAITQGTGAGTTSAPAAYDATGSNEGSGVDTGYRQFASSTGTAGSAIVAIKSGATISGVTPAASDYTDVIQVIGAGRF